MNTMDSSKIKSQLSLQHYETLFRIIGIDIAKQLDKKWILYTGCHNLHCQDGSPKLEFYTDTHMFHCYTKCSCSFDIYDLIAKRWRLERKTFSFVDILNFVVDTCQLSADKIQRYTKREDKNIDHWEDALSKYLKIKHGETLLKTYDESILNFFSNEYPLGWLNEGITIPTMDKFHIKRYRYAQQAVIPVYDLCGSLIGLHARNFNPDTVAVGRKYMPVRTTDAIEYKFPTNQVLYGANFNRSNIESTKEIMLFEAPKSVLQMESIVEHNNAVALFGMNMSKKQRDMILTLGVERVVVCLDRQYKEIDDDEYNKWQAQVIKIAKLFGGFCKVSVVYDRDYWLGYKDSPSDKGKEIWKMLYDTREEVEL